MMNCVRLVPGDAQLSNFHRYFMIFCTFFFSHVPHVYIAFCGHLSFGIRDGENELSLLRHFFL